MADSVEIMPPTRRAELQSSIAAAVTSYRDARTSGGGDVALWRPPLASADHAILKDAALLRARARDMVRNHPLPKNAVRMNRDAVTGSGMKLSLKIDWRSLGMKGIEEAEEWSSHVTRAWEAYAESADGNFQADVRRQQTFSQLMQQVDVSDYVDGESLAVIEMKPSFGAYRTCMSVIDVDRLSNPDGIADTDAIRAGIERDVHGAPLAYHIRERHPRDVGLDIGMNQFRWRRVPRMTEWGRPVVMHSFDMSARAEMTRGVSEFASIIGSSRMLQQYEDTELQSAITQAGFAAVITSELDWSTAAEVLGASSALMDTGNPLTDMVSAHMTNAADYAQRRELTFRGLQIPHLLPNEKLEFPHKAAPNQNFGDFQSAFIRHLAAGLGVEAHELGKNYADVNYSAARAALLAVWRTYKSRRIRLINQVAMPFFGAWLEEAVAIGTVILPKGVDNWVAAKPYLVRGGFAVWGKPMIDPLKERQGQQLGVQMGVENLEEIAADAGYNWRDQADQAAYERSYYKKLDLPHPSDQLVMPMQEQQPAKEDA